MEIVWEGGYAHSKAVWSRKAKFRGDYAILEKVSLVPRPFTKSLLLAIATKDN